MTNHGTINAYLTWCFYLYSKVKCTLVQALRLCTGRTAHRGSRGIALPFHDHDTRRGEGSASRSGRSLPPGKTRYPLYRRLGGPQGRSGQVRKISTAPGFSPQTVQPVTSRYTDWATRSTLLPVNFVSKFILVCRNMLIFQVRLLLPSSDPLHKYYCQQAELQNDSVSVKIWNVPWIVSLFCKSLLGLHLVIFTVKVILVVKTSGRERLEVINMTNFM